MNCYYHVYAHCWGGHDIYLTQEFSGTRSQCQTYMRHKIRQNRPTHFNFISCLPYHAATKRYVDN
jgi:hypothetical protein